MRALIFLAIIVVSFGGAVSGWAGTLKCDNTLRVSVLANGGLLIDGQPGDLKALDARLALLAKSQGKVWYYREASGSDPTPAAEATMTGAIDQITKNRLPVSLSSKSDFSDVIDEHGQSSPRTHC